MAKDYYKILGVEKSATADEIKKAYRRLAMKLHPDRNPGNKEAENQFKEVQEAYAVLSDEKKKALYDQLGPDGFANAAQGGGAGAGGFSGFENVGDIFGDLFGDIFGAARGGRGPRPPARGDDLLTRVRITLEEAALGCTKSVKIPQMVHCSECGGSGARKGTKPEKCKQCGGRGQVYMQQGFFSVQQTCHVCHGTGEVIRDPCSKCHGAGRVQLQKTLSVKIPAGVDDGDRVRLAGEGNAGEVGAPVGDLYVEIEVAEHPIFKREGLDLRCEIPISFVSAALGDDACEVPTLKGKVKLKIPEGTQSGKIFRLSGQGVRGVRGGCGDLYCVVHVETPVKLNAEQKELLRKFEESLAKDQKQHSPLARTWLDRVKDFFAKFNG